MHTEDFAHVAYKLLAWTHAGWIMLHQACRTCSILSSLPVVDHT